MSLSESTVKPCDYNPITLEDYSNAVKAAGSLERQGFPELAENVREAAREIRRRLEVGD